MPAVTTKPPTQSGTPSGADEVGERDVRLPGALRPLLAQRVQRRERRRPVLAGEEPDVVADRVRRPEADHRPRREPALGDDPAEHRPRVLEELPRRRALRRVVEDRRIAPLELPGLEERRPVDVARELGEIPARRTPACR